MLFRSAAAAGAVVRGATDKAGLERYTKALEADFVLADHRKFARAPGLVMSDRVQHRYPQMACNLVESMFTVTNPTPKSGVRQLLRREAKRAGVRLRDLAADGLAALRTFG